MNQSLGNENGLGQNALAESRFQSVLGHQIDPHAREGFQKVFYLEELEKTYGFREAHQHVDIAAAFGIAAHDRAEKGQRRHPKLTQGLAVGLEVLDSVMTVHKVILAVRHLNKILKV